MLAFWAFIGIIVIMVIALFVGAWLVGLEYNKTKAKLLENVSVLDNYASDRSVQLQFLYCITGELFPQDALNLALEKALSVLETSPGDEDIRHGFLLFLLRVRGIGIYTT